MTWRPAFPEPPVKTIRLPVDVAMIWHLDEAL